MLSIIIPAHNEAQHVINTVKEAVAALKSRGIENEIVVVDDGSIDGTHEKILSLAKECPTVNVFHYPQNSGKGYALKHGFQFCHGDEVLFLDADSDLPPSQIINVIDYFEANQCSIVIGSKRHPESEVRLPLMRRFLSTGYSLLVRILFGLNVRDTQTGLKLFKKEVLEEVFPKLLIKRYAFDVELLANARRLGYSMVEFPVILNHHGSSKVNIRAIWVMFWDTMATFYRLKIVRYYDRV